MRIIFIGMKGCGKTTLGTRLAERLHIPFIDSDAEIERTHRQERDETLTFRQIFARYGAAYFRALDMRMLQRIARAYGRGDFGLSCRGQTPLQKENQDVPARRATIRYPQAGTDVLKGKILASLLPARPRY